MDQETVPQQSESTVPESQPESSMPKPPQAEQKADQPQPAYVEHKIGSVGDLFKRSWALYKERFAKFIGIQLISVIGAFIYMALVVTVFSNTASLNQGVSFVLFLVSFVIMMVLSLIAQVATMYLLRPEEQRPIGQLLKAALPRFWPYVVVAAAMTVFIGLWSLLFIIPGIYFAIMYSMSYFVWFFEDYQSTAALKRSKELVKDYALAVLGRMAALGLLFWLVTMVVSIPGIVAGEDSAFGIIWQFVVQLVSFAIAPLAIIYFYNVYTDLARIKGASTIQEKTVPMWKNVVLISVAVLALLGMVFAISWASTVEQNLKEPGYSQDDVSEILNAQDQAELEKALQELEAQFEAEGMELDMNIESVQ